ncbi:mitochondrial ribosomal protein L37-domain-containing protein [Cristinia sonorae]|uniref:Large ribosomal subunit protein mL54 n=1 Tax=Cristinia sonorae TaxID=1940300 RepID=A0A8K0UY85_9AGAR|nr:mitochondrial ribosomal protein L37-domain-containing protein [Cristinia sonorae]
MDVVPTHLWRVLLAYVTTMSFLSALRRPQHTAPLQAWCRTGPCRCASTAAPKAGDNKPAKPSTTHTLSSCPEGTVLEGLNWLKGQPPVTALADEAYPPWLWKLLDPKVIPNDGPGGQGEKIRLRKENRKKIRDTQFMKTQ